MVISDVDECVRCFVNTVFVTAVAYDRFNSFNQFILSQDIDLKLTGNLFQSLIAFLDGKATTYSLMTINGRMNRHEQAVECAIRLYSSYQNLTDRICSLGYATVVLEQAMCERKKSQSPCQSTSRTFDQLQQWNETITLQQRLANLCYYRDIPFLNEPDFVTNVKAMSRATAFFLLHDDRPGCVDLAKRVNVSIDRILDIALSMFHQFSPDEVIRFVNRYIPANPGRRDRLLSRFMAGLALTPHWHVIAFLVVTRK
jgi:hypothetical protein